jgi:Fur family ferric uptake transcriptional regulator
MYGQHKWRQRFRKHVMRWTLPREAILNLLSKTSKHLSAKEIYDALSVRYPGIGLSTIYRTLELLVRAGFLTQMNIGDGQSRYEFKSGEKQEHHHHLICSECGKIIDYKDFLEEELELVRKAEKKLEGKYNFLVQGHNIDFYGLCRDCQK